MSDETPAAPEAPAPDPKGPSVPPAPVPSSDAPGASGTTAPTPADAPAGSSSPAASTDNVSELVRVAKAERKAAAAIKDAEAQKAALVGLQAKETKFGELVAAGSLLEAAKVYFPDNEDLRDKLFWQLNDYIADRPDAVPAKEPTVEERVAKAVEETLGAKEKAAAEKAEADKAAALADTDKQLAEQRAAYFTEARKVLAANAGAYPTVSAQLISGELTQDAIVDHVEAVAGELIKLGLPRPELVARIQAETAPDAIFAALEHVLGGTQAAPAAPAPGATQTLDEITAQAIAAAMRRSPTTISSAAVQGAAPVVQKQPRDMSVDELNAWAIAQVMNKRTAAAG